MGWCAGRFWRRLVVLGLVLGLGAICRKADAGACTSTACKCDSDCPGLLCSSDPAYSPGHCCGLPVTQGMKCAGSGGAGGTGGTGTGSGSGGASGDAATAADGAPGGGGNSGGCTVGGRGGAREISFGALFGAAAIGLAALRFSRRGSSPGRRSRRSCPKSR
jgi:hypothetical protein